MKKLLIFSLLLFVLTANLGFSNHPEEGQIYKYFTKASEEQQESLQRKSKIDHQKEGQNLPTKNTVKTKQLKNISPADYVLQNEKMNN